MQLLSLCLIVGTLVYNGKGHDFSSSIKLQAVRNYLDIGIDRYFDLHKEMQAQVESGIDAKSVSDAKPPGKPGSLAAVAKSISSFIGLPKSLGNTFTKKTKEYSEQDQLDEMWGVTTSLADFYESLDDPLTVIMESHKDDDYIAEEASEFMNITLHHHADMTAIADRLRRSFNKTLVTKFDKLNEEFENEITRLFTILFRALESTLLNVTATQSSQEPEKCAKVPALEMVCKHMNREWVMIRAVSIKDKCGLTVEKYPYEEMTLFLDGILGFCFAIKDYRRYCEKLANEEIYIGERSPKLRALTVELIEARGHLTDYYENLIRTTFKSVKKLENPKIARECRSSIKDSFLQLMVDMYSGINDLLVLYQENWHWHP